MNTLHPLKQHEIYVHDKVKEKVSTSPDEIGFSAIDHAFTRMSELRYVTIHSF